LIIKFAPVFPVLNGFLLSHFILTKRLDREIPAIGFSIAEGHQFAPMNWIRLSI